MNRWPLGRIEVILSETDSRDNFKHKMDHITARDESLRILDILFECKERRRDLGLLIMESFHGFELSVVAKSGLLGSFSEREKFGSLIRNL